MITNPICELCDGRCCRGCSLPYEQRPPSCQLYPFIAVGDTVELDLSCWGRISFKDKEAEAREVVR